MSIKINFKQGDSFLIECVVKIDDVVQDITDWTIASSIKNGAFTDSLVITKTNALLGTYSVSKADTTLWPTKALLCDVQYTLPSGQIISTENFEIICMAGVT